MKTRLVIPSTTEIPEHLVGTHKLTLTTNHPQSHYGLGVLVDEEGEVIDGNNFSRLRDTLSARIETDDAAAVCRALGLPLQSDRVNVGGLHPARGINENL